MSLVAFQKTRLLKAGEYEFFVGNSVRDAHLPDACGLEKIPNEMSLAYAPAERGRARYQLWREQYKEGISPFERVAEGKMSVEVFFGTNGTPSPSTLTCLIKPTIYHV